MHGIRVRIIAFVDSSYPGWVRAVFNDVHGKEWSIVEKAPIVTDKFLDENSYFPVAGFVAGTIVSRSVNTSKQIVTIDLSQPWCISTEEGQQIFDVLEEQIVEV